MQLRSKITVARSIQPIKMLERSYSTGAESKIRAKLTLQVSLLSLLL